MQVERGLLVRYTGTRQSERDWVARCVSMGPPGRVRGEHTSVHPTLYHGRRSIGRANELRQIFMIARIIEMNDTFNQT